MFWQGKAARLQPYYTCSHWRIDVNTKTYCTVSGVLFTVVALAHLLRIINGMSVQVDDYSVPMLVSWVGLVVPAALAAWAFRLTRR